MEPKSPLVSICCPPVTRKGISTRQAQSEEARSFQFSQEAAAWRWSVPVFYDGGASRRPLCAVVDSLANPAIPVLATATIHQYMAEKEEGR